MIKRIHIYDMDGTLVDSSHRYRTMPCGTRIDLQYWIDNECKTLEDTLLPETARFRELVESPEDYVVIATARIWCELTQQFVEKNDIQPNCIFARRDREDTRGGAQLKIQGIKKLLNLKQFRNVEEFHVYEDNVSYMKTICDEFNGKGYYFPSRQGH